MILTILNDSYWFLITQWFSMRRWYLILAPLIMVMSLFTSISNHRDIRRHSALASVVAMATGKRKKRKRRRRSARIVGGGNQRGPTERRQQAESLAHSFSVPLACSFSFSLRPVPSLGFSVSVELYGSLLSTFVSLSSCLIAALPTHQW